MKYRIVVNGLLTYPELDGEGNPQTSGIDNLEHEFEAVDNPTAKQVFKDWAAEKFVNSGAIKFEGSVTGYTIDETEIITDAPFTVELSIAQNVVTDF